MSDITIEQVVDFLKRTPFNEQGPVFTTLVEKLDTHRQLNKGYTPTEIFGQCIGIGGRYTCIEICTAVYDAESNLIGFALKQRDGKNDPWKGQYNGTGVALRRNDTLESALKRAGSEAYGDDVQAEPLKHIGWTLHSEPERWTMCDSQVFLRKATAEQINGFCGNWKIFAADDIFNVEIIDHHRQILFQVLRWLNNPDEAMFADIRNHPVAASTAT